MHFLVSPAKSLDFETPALGPAPTTPQFLSDARALIELLRAQSSAEIAALMDLSDALVALNVARYREWSARMTVRNSKPAVLAFNGDVYDGLDARSLSAADLQWAQGHVSILSGLYGVLRPLDRIQPHRLEMGTALANQHGKNLYAYWGDRLAEHLNAQLAADPECPDLPVIVNLASQEYFKAVHRKLLRPRVIECVFEDWKGGRYKVISFFAKRARGLMLRHAIQTRLDTPEALQAFALAGYAYAPLESSPDRLVFRRRITE
jgi:uncharacterized protein